MLNYIWLSLIVLGIGVAVATDVHDLTTDRYHNGAEYPCVIGVYNSTDPVMKPGKSYSCSVYLDEASEKCVIVPAGPGAGSINVTIDNNAPKEWSNILAALNNPQSLQGKIRWQYESNGIITGWIALQNISFVRMNAVTNEGVIKSAKTAVELSIGLIGIMALWLGIMKIAEQAGLVAALGRILKPITRLVFPEIPADHPAIGAMIMNISANMLGLSNAATPFGLKAMEELNKLNPKAGTATDSMCTFLVINTGNLQLIPATTIAIRAAAGSANPAEILGTVIIVTFVTMIVGITSVKLLAKLPSYRR